MDPLEQLKDELRAVLPPIDKKHMQLRKQDQPESWTIQQVAAGIDQGNLIGCKPGHRARGELANRGNILRR